MSKSNVQLAFNDLNIRLGWKNSTNIEGGVLNIFLFFNMTSWWEEIWRWIKVFNDSLSFQWNVLKRIIDIFVSTRACTIKLFWGGNLYYRLKCLDTHTSIFIHIFVLYCILVTAVFIQLNTNQCTLKRIKTNSEWIPIIFFW